MRTDDELWELSKKLAPEYPYSANCIFEFFSSLYFFDWRNLSEDNLRDLLNQRVAYGFWVR